MGKYKVYACHSDKKSVLPAHRRFGYTLAMIYTLGKTGRSSRRQARILARSVWRRARLGAGKNAWLATLVLPVLLAGCRQAGGPAPDPSAAIPPASQAAPAPQTEESATETVAVIDAGRTESVLAWQGGLLLSDMGRASILYHRDGVTETWFGPEAGLHSPTGMAVQEHWLFVADRDRVAVLDLEDPQAPLQEIRFGGERGVNDVAVADGVLYTTVTGTGHIYKTELAGAAQPADAVPELWLSLPGPNGTAVADGAAYIASISPDYHSVRLENVIYRVGDLQQPAAEAVAGIEPGQYDGVALSEDGGTLYVSDWNTASVTALDLATGQVQTVYQEDGIGPADLDVAGDRLYLPDLNGSRVLVIPLESG